MPQAPAHAPPHQHAPLPPQTQALRAALAAQPGQREPERAPQWQRQERVLRLLERQIGVALPWRGAARQTRVPPTQRLRVPLLLAQPPEARAAGSRFR